MYLKNLAANNFFCSSCSNYWEDYLASLRKFQHVLKKIAAFSNANS